MNLNLNRFLIVSAIAWPLVGPAHAQTASSALPAGIAATVNGVPVTQAEVDVALHGLRQADTPNARQAVKNQLITHLLIQQAADKANYASKPDVQAAMQVAKSNAEVQLYLKDNAKPESVTDAQVKARYDGLVASLGKDEYKPRLIVVKDAATAEAILASLKGGTSFDALARQYSIAPSRDVGGELSWVSFKTPVQEGNTQGFPRAVVQAITQLPVGGVAPEPIQVDNVRVIVKLDAKRPTQVPGFDQAKETIRQQLQALALQKASAQLVSELVKGASITQ